jgi:hypothetical protein
MVFSGLPKSVIVQFVGPQSGVVEGIGFIIIDTMTRPNDNASQTTAGTNASPINSFISNDSPLSFPNTPSQRTYFRVMSGEKIA